MAKERKNTGKEIAETQRLINELKKLASAGSDTKAIFESVRTILNSPSPLLAKQVEDLSKIATKSTQVQNSLKNLAQVQGTLGETARDVILEYNDLVDATDRIATSQKDLDNSFKKSSKGFKQQAKDTKSQSQASQDLNKKIGEQSTAMRAAMEAAAQYSKVASNLGPLKIEVPTVEDFTKPGGPLDPNFYYQTPGQNTQAQPTNTNTQTQPTNTNTQTQPTNTSTQAQPTQPESSERTYHIPGIPFPVNERLWNIFTRAMEGDYTGAAAAAAGGAANVVGDLLEGVADVLLDILSELTGLSGENLQTAGNVLLAGLIYQQIGGLIEGLYNSVKNLTTAIMNIGEEAARKLSQPIEDALGFLTLRQANIIAERTRDTAFYGALTKEGGPGRFASYEEYLNVLAAFAQETGRIGTVADVNRQNWTDATEASVALIAELGDYSQMGSGEVLKLSRLFTRLGGLDPLGTLGEQFSLFVVKAAEAEGIVPEIITKDVLENADLLSTYFANNAMSATKTALAVRKLGFALGDIASLEDFFYNYEASTQAALEFQVATGMKFDPTEARTALVSGDIESFVRNLIEQISYDEFQSMSGPQRKLAATAFGLEGRVDKLQDILQIYETTGGEGLDKDKLKEIEEATLSTDIGLLNEAKKQNEKLGELIGVMRDSYLVDGAKDSTKQADLKFDDTMVYKQYDRLLEDLEYNRLDKIRTAFNNTLDAIEGKIRETHNVIMDTFLDGMAAAAGQFIVELTDSVHTTVTGLPKVLDALEKLQSDDENVRKEGSDYLLEQADKLIGSSRETLKRIIEAYTNEQITVPPTTDLGLPNYSVPPIERQIEDGIVIPYEDEALEYYKEMVVSLDRLGEKMDKNVNALRDKNLNTSVYLDSRNMYNTFSDYGTNYRLS